MERKKNIYLSISYIVVIIVSAYIALSMWIIDKQLYKEYDLTFFTGKPVLEIDSNKIYMSFNLDARVIEFKFTEKLDRVMKRSTYAQEKEDGTSEEIVLFRTELSNDKKWVTLTVADREIIKNRLISIDINSFEGGGSRSRFFMDAVRVDGKNVDVYDFLDKNIDSNYGNIILHIPHSLSNLSTNLASNFGNYILGVIKFVLIVLFITQLFLYIIAFVWQPEEISDYFNTTNPDKDISIIDAVARNYAIPLGFMGTVFAIWTALEMKQQQFSDFNSVLEIFKGGIFTTVLGLSTNLVCILRRNRIMLRKLFKANKNED